MSRAAGFRHVPASQASPQCTLGTCHPKIRPPGTVLISEHTYRAVADYFECEPLGHLAVKGMRQDLFEIDLVARDERAIG